MGVYNELYKKCPACADGCGYTQMKLIAEYECQTFRLDDADEMSSLLNETEMQELSARLKDEWFRCGGAPYGKGGCGKQFLLSDSMDRRKALAVKLFGGN
jgi:hypothetical protein